jgi:hypothetical protein
MATKTFPLLRQLMDRGGICGVRYASGSTKSVSLHEDLGPTADRWTGPEDDLIPW